DGDGFGGGGDFEGNGGEAELVTGVHDNAALVVLLETWRFHAERVGANVDGAEEIVTFGVGGLLSAGALGGIGQSDLCAGDDCPLRIVHCAGDGSAGLRKCGTRDQNQTCCNRHDGRGKTFSAWKHLTTPLFSPYIDIQPMWAHSPQS